MFLFYTTWKHQITFDFLKFPEGIEIENCVKSWLILAQLFVTLFALKFDFHLKQKISV